MKSIWKNYNYNIIKLCLFFSFENFRKLTKKYYKTQGNSSAKHLILSNFFRPGCQFSEAHRGAVESGVCAEAGVEPLGGRGEARRARFKLSAQAMPRGAARRRPTLLAIRCPISLDGQETLRLASPLRAEAAPRWPAPPRSPARSSAARPLPSGSLSLSPKQPGPV